MKWADYCISAVRYDKDRRFIEMAVVHVDEGEAIGDGHAYPRDEIIKAFGLLKSFATISGDPQNGWRKSGEMRAVEYKGMKYLRADNAKEGFDSVGCLPEF